MKILLYGTSIFCAAFFLHLFIWKIKIPRNCTMALLWIFSITLIVGLAILWSTKQVIDIFEYIHITLFFLSLMLTYISIYSAIEAGSPSLLMVMNIYQAGREGLKKETFLSTLTDDLLLNPRLKELLDAKLVYLNSNKYKLTLRGNLFIRIFIFYRKFLRLSKGG